MWQTRSGDFALRQADLPPPFQYHSRLGCGREGLTGKKVKQRQQQGVVEPGMIDDMFKCDKGEVVVDGRGDTLQRPCSH